MGMATHTAGPGSVPSPSRSVRRTGLIDRALAIAIFAMFVVVWVGFAVALRGDGGFLDSSWQWLRELPGLVQVVVWVLILPIAVGLWAWESTWTPFVGLLLVAGMIAWTVVAIAGLTRAFRSA